MILPVVTHRSQHSQNANVRTIHDLIDGATTHDPCGTQPMSMCLWHVFGYHCDGVVCLRRVIIDCVVECCIHVDECALHP